MNACRAEQGVAAPLQEEQEAVLNSLPDDIPIPVIKIDNQHDPFATVVTIEYGDRLGELLDTVHPGSHTHCHQTLPFCKSVLIWCIHCFATQH